MLIVRPLPIIAVQPQKIKVGHKVHVKERWLSVFFQLAVTCAGWFYVKQNDSRMVCHWCLAMKKQEDYHVKMPLRAEKFHMFGVTCYEKV